MEASIVDCLASLLGLCLNLKTFVSIGRKTLLLPPYYSIISTVYVNLFLYNIQVNYSSNSQLRGLTLKVLMLLRWNIDPKRTITQHGRKQANRRKHKADKRVAALGQHDATDCVSQHTCSISVSGREGPPNEGSLLLAYTLAGRDTWWSHLSTTAESK